MPTLFAPTPPVGKINKIVPISEGGTGGASVEEARENLGAIDASMVNQPGGPMGLDNDGKLTIDTSMVSLSSGPTVNGPLSVETGTVTNYQITNFHAATTYTVSAISGSIVQNGETLIYTAPGTMGAGGFVLNGKTYDISVTQRSPQVPSITSPINGATNIPSRVTVTSSAFTMTSGSDTHAASHWQISTSSTFATILYESVDDTVNKTSWTSGVLAVSTKYYIRVRYKGTTYGYSGWSSARQVTTKSDFFLDTETAKIIASDPTASAFFGIAVAMSSDGNTAAIGAFGDASGKGAAYVFTRTGSTWTQQQKLLSTDIAVGDNFGISVSLSSAGNMVLIGAHGKSSSTGAAYVFTRSGSTWTQQAKLVASDGATNKYFGRAVSISDDGLTALIGSPGGGAILGSAYIFTWSGSTWTQQAKLVASDGAAGDQFGYTRLDISGDGQFAIIGAFAKSDNTGAVYVFSRAGSVWTQQAKLVASDAATNGRFGASARSSTTGAAVIIGSNTIDGSGAAYIFTRSGSAWTQQAKLVASDAAAGDQFGNSVFISEDGTVVLVGALAKNSNTGAAYLFTATQSIWSQQAKLTGSDVGTNDYFGTDVCFNSDYTVALVSAYYQDEQSPTALSSGAVYVFS